MIPEAKQEAVARALGEAFRVTECEEMQRLTAGLSAALVFRIVVRGCAYLLRVVKSTGSAAGPGQGDQTRHFTCMRLAAEAGLGPRVWYANATDGVSITDFVEARSFPRAEALARMPGTLAALHGTAPFPKLGRANHLDVMGGFIRSFQAAKLLPESETGELFEGYERVAGVYPRGDAEMVSSHNDLNPTNILFDGARVWLVDWEAGFLNDRYVDLAVVANFLVTDEGAEEAYLRGYFGEAAGEYRRARFYLMQQILHTAYAALCIRVGAGGKAVDTAAEVPEFREFHDRLWAREISLESGDAKVAYGRAHLKQAVVSMRTERFREALRLVSARHGGG